MHTWGSGYPRAAILAYVRYIRSVLKPFQTNSELTVVTEKELGYFNLDKKLYNQILFSIRLSPVVYILHTVTSC
jgi:hypothetical protein